MESPRPTEDQFTKNIEKYTAAIPSTGYLAVAIGAMALSLACQAAGRQMGQLHRPMCPHG
jgi:hypothetical protein